MYEHRLLEHFPFRYRVWGLSVASSAALPGLPLEENPMPPELLLRFGLASAQSGTSDDSARYTVREVSGPQGRVFMIDFYEVPATEYDALQFAHEGARYLWMQRGALVLHGTAVRLPAGAVVIVGQSGSGKSTLAAALHRRGFEVVSDDLTILCPQHDASMQVVALGGDLHLPRESASYLGLPIKAEQQLPGEEKYALPLVMGAAGSVPLGCLCCLAPGQEDAIRIQALDGEAAWAALLEHINPSMYVADGLTPRHIQERLAAICASAPVYRMLRPVGRFAPD
jgi:hypothetical protein